MSKILLFVILCCTSFANAQIKVIDCDKIGVVKALMTTAIEMKKCNIEGNTQYIIHYRDITEQHIGEWNAFAFLDIDNAFENLYNMIMDGFENPPKEDIGIDLPDCRIYLHFEKNMGITSFQFLHFPTPSSKIIGQSTYLTKRQVKKLFGK